MSAIEQAVKPILGPMMNGEARGLTEDDQLRLAQWIALKMMVLERLEPDEPIIVPAEARRAFAAVRQMPSNLQIWLFWCPDPRTAAFLRRDLAGFVMEGQDPRVTGYNTQVVGFGVRQVFIYASQSEIPDLDLNLRNLDALHSKALWPIRAQHLIWPAERPISFEFAEAMLLAFSRFIDRKTPM